MSADQCSFGQNRATVLRHFDAKLACDADALAADLTAAVRWWAPRSTDRLGLPRPLEGRDAVVAMLVSVPLYQPDIFAIPHSRFDVLGCMAAEIGQHPCG